MESLFEDQRLYHNNRDNTVRYVLGKEGKNPLLCFGVNPSTAAPWALDNTLKSVERMAIRWWFDGWIMLNLYAQRATNPNDIHLEIDHSLHQDNLSFIRDIFMKYPSPTIWAAWWWLVKKRSFLKNCLRDIYDLSIDNQCKRISAWKPLKDGHPHHPLYLSNTVEIEEFDIDGYISSLG